MATQSITLEGARARAVEKAPNDERLLVAQAKSGRSSAFGELYERHRLRIYHSAFRILRNRQDAEDAAQRAFQRAFTNLNRFREDSAFSTWVTRIAINEALMLLRQRRATKLVSESSNIDDLQAPAVLDLADDHPTPEQTLAQNELRGIVMQAISRLRGSLRTVALLRELQGFTSVETARHLGLTVSAVKARTFHARRHLRQYFERKYKVGLGRQRKGIRSLVCLTMLLLSCFTTKVCAQTATLTSDRDSASYSQPRQYLFGDWGGKRSELASRGVTFSFFYVADLQANPYGGLEQTQAGWGRIRGTMDVDFGKLTDWNGLTLHATGLWQFGTNLGANIGVIANPSGLVSAHATRLDSWWLQQAFFNNHLFVKAGQLAGLDFYGNQIYGASYLIEPLDYAFGNLFTNTFESFNPAGTPGVQIRVQATHNFYLTAAAISGNRNPYQQDTTGLSFVIKDSPDFLFEAGYTHGYDNPSAIGQPQKVYPGTFKFGAAYNGGKFANPAGVRSSGNYLIYGDINQALYRTDAGLSRGLDGTIGFDWSPDDVDRQNSQITAGLRYNGLIPSRPQDAVSFAVVYSKISDPFRFAEAAIGLPLLGSEKALELNYAYYVTPYVLFQPVFQYYVDVGANSRIPNASIFGFRTQVNF